MKANAFAQVLAPWLDPLLELDESSLLSLLLSSLLSSDELDEDRVADDESDTEESVTTYQFVRVHHTLAHSYHPNTSSHFMLASLPITFLST